MNHAVSNYKRIMRKGLQNRRFLEKADAHNLQDFAEAALYLQFFFDNRHQHVDADGNPYLCLDRVVRGPEERLDAKVLFDPFEEQFDLPATAIQLRYRQRRQSEV